MLLIQNYKILQSQELKSKKLQKIFAFIIILIELKNNNNNMSKYYINFPKNFFWGAATSSHQVEGNNHNDWTEWEKSEKRINFLRSNGLIEKYGLENYISGKAADHYNRFQDDFKIAKELGHNATRFSIE